MSNITVLGLGAMGSRMATNYAHAGHDVTVWNRTASTAEQLAAANNLTAAKTPRSAAAGADVVMSMVSDDEAARSVWVDGEHGALSAMSSGAIAIESSTLTAATTRELADAARDAGVGFVEAPVVLSLIHI